MSISTQLFTALSPLVGSRCYPLTFEQPDGNLPTWPAIRYTRNGGDPHTTICGSGDGVGVGYTDTEQYQIDIVAKTYSALDTLEAQVRAALDGLVATLPITIETTPSREFDADTRTYRAIVQITVNPF